MISSMVTTKLLDFLLISLLALSVVYAEPDAMAEADPDAMAEANPNAMADPEADPLLKISQYIIHRTRPNPYQKCDKDEECIKAYTYCIDNHCKCLNTYKMNDDHSCSLLGGPGSSCTTNADCKAPDSVCKDGRCECAEGMVTDGSFCFTPADYDGDCEKVVQCPNQEYFACTGGKCLCADNAVFVPGSGCIPKVPLGGDCDFDIQCSSKIPNSECKDGKCACITDFQLNAAEDACVPASFEVDNDVASDDAWNVNYGDDGHADTVAYKAAWEAIFLSVDGVIRVVSMTCENSGGKVLIKAKLEVANPDKAGTRRRRSMDEPEENMEAKPEEGQPQAVEGQPQAVEEQAQAKERQAQAEERQAQTAREAEQEEEECALVKTLKEREVKELSSPITVSAPDILISGDVNPLDKFCLQNIDCPSHVCDKFACM